MESSFNAQNTNSQKTHGAGRRNSLYRSWAWMMGGGGAQELTPAQMSPSTTQKIKKPLKFI